MKWIAGLAPASIKVRQTSRVDYNKLEVIIEAETPKAPPCSGCRHWAATYTYQGRDRGGPLMLTEARLCHTPQFFRDFSCFEEREK